MKFIPKETASAQSVKTRRVRAAKLQGKIDKLERIPVPSATPLAKFQTQALRDLLESIDAAGGRLKAKTPESKSVKIAFADTRKAKDGRVISVEVLAPVERFYAREVSRFCVRRYRSADGVCVDVSRRAGEGDLMSLETLWKLLQSAPNANYVFAWKRVEAREGSNLAVVREAISNVMISTALRKQYRVLSALTASWWESLSVSCIADLVKPRALLTAKQYRELSPFTGWTVQRKKKNAVLGVIAYDARTRVVSILTDRGVLVRLADVQHKDLAKSFVVECDVVVETLQVTPVRLVNLYQPQWRRDNKLDVRLAGTIRGIKEVLGERVNILDGDCVFIPSFLSGHQKQLCRDLRALAKLLISDQRLPDTTPTDKFMQGGAGFIKEAVARMREASSGKEGDHRAAAIMLAAKQYEKQFLETHADAATFIERTVKGLAAKPQTVGISFVGDEGDLVLEWESVDSAEFEFVAFRKEGNRYALTVSMSQDLASEERLNIPKIHRFVEEYFGKVRVSAHNIPTRFRPFWRQADQPDVDELVSTQDVDRKVIRARWTEQGWQLIGLAKRQGLGMDLVAAETKWTQLRSGATSSGFWKILPAPALRHVPCDQLEAIKAKFMTEQLDDRVVLDIGTMNAELYAGVGCDEVVFAANLKAVLEDLAQNRLAIIHGLSRRGDTALPRYPRMTGFVCSQDDLVSQASSLYQKQINTVFCNMDHDFLERSAWKMRELSQLLRRESDRVCLIFVDGRAVHEEIFQRNAVKPSDFFAFGGNLKPVFTRFYTEEIITEKHLVRLEIQGRAIDLRLTCPDFLRSKMEDAGFKLVEEGNFGTRAALLEADVRMFARLHAFQVYKPRLAN